MTEPTFQTYTGEETLTHVEDESEKQVVDEENLTRRR